MNEITQVSKLRKTILSHLPYGFWEFNFVAARAVLVHMSCYVGRMLYVMLGDWQTLDTVKGMAVTRRNKTPVALWMLICVIADSCAVSLTEMSRDVSKASVPSYKWWETSDKTKRLYTELLAEKLSSPRNSGSSKTKSFKTGVQNQGREEVMANKDKQDRKGSSVQQTSTPKDLGGSALKKTIEKEESSEKKYTFETITMDTLAKYDYIRSPTKEPGPRLSSLPDTTQNAKSSTELLSQPRAKDSERQVPYGGLNGQFLLSKKLSTPAKVEVSTCGGREKAGLKSSSATSKSEPSGVSLQGASGISGKNEAVKSCEDQKESIISMWDKKVASIAKKSARHENTTEEKVEDLNQKYQMLSDEVDKLEVKLSDFSADVKNITISMGFKEAKDDTSELSKTIRSPRKPQLSSFKDKYGFAPVLDSKTSPAKPFTSLSYKNLAMPALKSKEELDAEIRQIKERQLTEDEIQEVLRCARAKYLDNPNYLKDLGCDTRPEARLND